MQIDAIIHVFSKCISNEVPRSPQGSLKVWKYPLPTLFDDENNTMGSFKMLPTMDPVNLLCRVYVVKVIPFYILRARSLISGFPA